MRPGRLSFVSTPSEKSLTYATQDSQGNLSMGYYLPCQNQKRFTRKNNGSIEKKKSKSNLLQTQPQCSLISTRYQETPKVSKQKATPSYIKVNLQLKDSRLNQSHGQLEHNMRSGSFKVNKNRTVRRNKLQDTIRISQQKPTSRYSGKSIDSKGSRYGKQNNISVLRTQLELKEKELMVLEDERRRFRNSIQELKRKQATLLQQMKKNETQFKQMEQKFKQNVNQLQKKIEEISKCVNTIQNQNQKLKKQLQSSEKQRKIVERQLKMFTDKQVPKNIRDLQSCREISLEQTIQQLKIQLNRNKSQVEREMQYLLQKQRMQNLSLKEEIKSYELVNRMLEKKAGDAKRYLQAYTSIKAQYRETRRQNRELREECELLRKQNVKMKKEIKQMMNHHKNLLVRKKQKTLSESRIMEGSSVREYVMQKILTRVPSQSQSLCLSISQQNNG